MAADTAVAEPLLLSVTAEAYAVTAWAFDVACVLQFAILVPEPHAASQCRCEDYGLWAAVCHHALLYLFCLVLSKRNRRCPLSVLASKLAPSARV